MKSKKMVYAIISAGIFFLLTAAVSQGAEQSTAELGTQTFGIICVPVAHLREHPRSGSELGDQEIMGYPIELLDCQDEWYKVKTEYGEIGWMTGKSFCRVDKAGMKLWADSRKVMVSKIFAQVYSQPDEKSQPVVTAAMNALLKRVEQVDANWLKVSTPDGRVGFLKSDCAADWPVKKIKGKQLQDALVRDAKSMMGVPYLWGGKSSTACDCSGFTQTIFRANGIMLPRNSWLQARVGQNVEYLPDFSNVQAGDLVFFGTEKITHVGMSIGGAEFIHQSGDVHINSFDPNAANYNSRLRKILKEIKRVH